MSGIDTRLLDTNAIIYFLKGTAPHVKELFTGVQNGNEKLLVSVISKIELLSFQNEQEVNDIQILLSSCDIAQLTDQIVDRAILIRRTQRLKTPDAIIAATALTLKVPLVSANTKDFEKVEHLDIELP